jgi:hypothetical protein
MQQGKPFILRLSILYTEFGIQKTQRKPSNSRSPQYDSERNGYYWNDHIRADFNAFENLNYDEKTAKDLRESGFGTVLSFKFSMLAIN